MKERFTRFEVLLLQYFKRDYKKIIIWIIGIGLFSAGFVPFFVEIAKEQGLIGMYETMKNPAMVSMVGNTPIIDSSSYTVGAMYSHMMLLFCSIFAMIVSILHVISHTRKEEDSGLTELIRSFEVGKISNSLAVIIETIIINIILGLFISFIMLSFNHITITLEGSILFGSTIALAGILGATIALVVAQIMPSSSSSTGLSLALIGFLYIIRGITDITNVKLSMINPVGWTYLSYPFTTNNWLPILYISIFSLILIIKAFILEENRDMGSGYLSEKQGRASAKKSLLSVRGLLLKLNKGMILAWLTSFIVLAAAYGSIYGDMHSFIESNDLIKQMFSHSGFTLEESFTSIITMVISSLAAILPIAIINKLYNEEKSLRLNIVISTKVSRAKFYFTTIIIAIFSSVLALILSSLALGLAAIYSGDPSLISLDTFIYSGLNFMPSLLFYIGLSSMILGFIPRQAKLVYVYLGYSFVLNYFTGIINLPNWLLNTTIINWIPRMPIESFNISSFISITVISIILIITGFIGYKKRDFDEL
ncbi:MAG: tetronasin resistance protein [Bacilli bacterium]|nr:tetronasin resistance protein [Bacilli bacterium]